MSTLKALYRCKKFTAKTIVLLVINTTLPLDNPLYFRYDFLQRI